MRVETQDGIRVLKLSDRGGPQGGVGHDDLAMLHLWRLLSGGHPLRDNTAISRRYL